MEKLILRSKSEAELKEKVKNMLTLNEDETIEIVELSKPGALPSGVVQTL